MTGRRAPMRPGRRALTAPVLLLLAVIPCVVACAPSDGMDHSLLDGLLGEHVRGGRVDYAALREDPRLPAYLGLLARTTDGQVGGRRAQMTYWLNAYTSFVIQGVLEHYPIRSIREVGEGDGLIRGFHRFPKFRVGGHDYSLNTILHKIIRREFPDPRIHLALADGTLGGPSQRPGAFHAGSLERDLEEAARRFIRDPAKVRLDPAAGVLTLSPIFEWYGEQFAGEAGSLRGFLWRYLPWDERQGLRAPGLRIVFSPHDWSLNDASR